MKYYLQRSIPIRDASQPSAARRLALSMAETLEFNVTKRGETGIIVTEAARNVYIHGGGGEMVLGPWRIQEATGIDILALDQGPGMQDVARCIRDGYSTGGTAGTGLGAISRLASVFEVYSLEAQGTAILAQVVGKNGLNCQPFQTGAVSIPQAGETVCGDSWGEMHLRGRSLFIVADGLGHGKAAAEASQEAIRVFYNAPELGPEQMLRRMNDALQKTRGAAVAIAEIDTRRGIVRYGGVGNVAGCILTNESSRSMVSHSGIVGHTFPHVQEFTYEWQPHSLLVMQSDGLTSRWDLRRYPGLELKHPSLIAGVLYRDANRKRDDATILVSRESKMRT
jgi:anti-sigma regulatory factor (Ser/Thr protein kinase)/serine/threonine protein phosphatase PrpC